MPLPSVPSAGQPEAISTWRSTNAAAPSRRIDRRGIRRRGVASLGQAQLSRSRARTARSRASSGVAPSTVTCPILRRSKTCRLSYRWRWTPGSVERLGDARKLRRTPLAAAEQVDHRRSSMSGWISQGQAADRPDVLLELAGRGAFDRPMAAVVDPRRQLVDDERAIREQEQLDGQGSDHIEGFSEVGRDPLGPCRDLGGHRQRRGDEGLEQDPGVVPIAPGGERHGPAVEPAGDDHRQLAGKVELAFEQQACRVRRTLEVPPGGFEIGRPGQADLRTAVVAADRGLEPKRPAQVGGRGVELGAGPNLAPGRDRRSGTLRGSAARRGDPGSLPGPASWAAAAGSRPLPCRPPRQRARARRSRRRSSRPAASPRRRRRSRRRPLRRQRTQMGSQGRDPGSRSGSPSHGRPSPASARADRHR